MQGVQWVSYVLDVDEDWSDQAKRILQAEMRRKGITAAQLAERLGENPKTVSNRISEGRFSMAWALECLAAMGVRRIELE